MNNPSLEERVTATRASVAREASIPSAPEREKVQLAVRIPAELRRRIHGAAERSDAASLQEWVTDVLTAAVDATADPARRMADRLARELQERLQDPAVRDAYRADVDSLDDPDVRD